MRMTMVVLISQGMERAMVVVRIPPATTAVTTPLATPTRLLEADPSSERLHPQQPWVPVARPPLPTSEREMFRLALVFLHRPLMRQQKPQHARARPSRQNPYRWI